VITILYSLDFQLLGKNRAKKSYCSALSSSYLWKTKMANIKNVLLLIAGGAIALTIDDCRSRDYPGSGCFIMLP
jgi:hypothetical protein